MFALAGTANAAPTASAHESNGHGGSVQRTRPVVYRTYGGRYYYGRPYYGWGAGAGFAAGAGLGYLFAPGAYAYIPYSVRGGYAADPAYPAIPAYPNTPNGDPRMKPPAAVGETGLRITDVLDGPAKKAELRAGDIILGIGETRTQTFEELQSALAASKGKVEVVFINGENKNVEKLPVTPVNNKLGIAVVPATVR
jgi:membrane-associated protease RseP (regulator of RpoE activity)